MIMAGTCLLYIKFNSATVYPVEINESTSVLELKSKLSKKIGTEIEDLSSIQLILAGKILKDDLNLKDLQIENFTVLHAFRQKPTLVATGGSYANNSVDKGEPSDKRDIHHEYYVFCKKCKSLQPGKLRVVCARCKQGQIILDTLDREPDGFQDVLQAGAITGECKNETCQSRQNTIFYFKCCNHQSEPNTMNELDQSEPVLQHVRPNRKRVECITCSEIMNPVLIFSCYTHHIMCLDCFQSYCVVQLNERRFVEDPQIGYSLPCPAGCPNSLIKDAHHFYLLGSEQYERYKNFGAEEYILQNGGILCPAIGCGVGFILDGNQRKIVCHACRAEFCRECRGEYHVEEQCMMQAFEATQQEVNVDLEHVMRARWNMESLETIEKISKPCPGCKTKTERSGGCMHMKCSQCQKDWCWICETPWNRDCQGNHWFG